MNLATIAALALLPITASAQTVPPSPPRAFDMTLSLTGLDGKTPIPDMAQATTADPTCAKCEPLTIGSVVERALLTPLPGDSPPPPSRPGESAQPLSSAQTTQGFARIALALRLHNNMHATLNEKELAVVVKRIELGFANSIIAFRAVQMLAPDDADLKATAE
jgi:hypothetical protein